MQRQKKKEGETPAAAQDGIGEKGGETLVAQDGRWRAMGRRRKKK